MQGRGQGTPRSWAELLRAIRRDGPRPGTEPTWLRALADTCRPSDLREPLFQLLVGFLLWWIGAEMLLDRPEIVRSLWEGFLSGCAVLGLGVIVRFLWNWHRAPYRQRNEALARLAEFERAQESPLHVERLHFVEGQPTLTLGEALVEHGGRLVTGTTAVDLAGIIGATQGSVPRLRTKVFLIRLVELGLAEVLDPLPHSDTHSSWAVSEGARYRLTPLGNETRAKLRRELARQEAAIPNS